MLTVDELWQLIDRTIQALPACEVSLAESLSRRLGETVVAGEDMPAFSRSAIDGFAVAAKSKPGRRRIVGETKPGMAIAMCPEEGEAVRIYTGSALPPKGVGLVMVEDADVSDEEVVIKVAPSERHIREKGSQARTGQVLISEGSVIGAGAIALLASIGRANIMVSPTLRVAHLVTGSEVVPLGETTQFGCIWDSNSSLVAALLAETGVERTFHAHANETVEEGIDCLRDVKADIFLISGGASVGAYDGTAEVLRRLGFTIHSDKVKSRPGKPLIFATRGQQVAFGLPGNPLSHFVCFHLFVQRAIARLSGLPTGGLVKVELAADSPPPDTRETWWPAQIRIVDSRAFATPLPWRDSSDLTGLPAANALLRINPSGTNGLVEALIFGKLTT